MMPHSPVLVAGPFDTLILDAAVCALTAFLLMVLIVGTCMMARYRMAWISAGMRGVLLALLLPGVAGAAYLPLFMPHAEGVVLSMLQGLLLCPLVTLFPLWALERLPANVSRTAWGLGAGPWMQVRMLWLPLLGPALMLSACAGVVTSLMAAMADLGRGMGAGG